MKELKKVALKVWMKDEMKVGMLVLKSAELKVVMMGGRRVEKMGLNLV